MLQQERTKTKTIAAIGKETRRDLSLTDDKKRLMEDNYRVFKTKKIKKTHNVWIQVISE